MNESTCDVAVQSERECRPLARYLWSSAAGLALVGTAILFGAKPGLNCPAFTFAMSALLWHFDADRGRAWRRPQHGLIALACILSGSAAVTTDATLSAEVVVTVVWLLAGAALLQAGLPLADFSLVRLCSAPLSAATILLREVAVRTGDAAHGIRDGRYVAALRGVVWAAPIVGVFFLLLAEADPTLSAWRSSLWQALIELSFLPRVAFFCLLATGLLGAFGVAAAPRLHEFRGNPARQPRAVRSATERCIVLGSVAALFALFLLLQLSYLFGNPGGQAGSGLSYADAVHRGFGELTVVVSLTALLVIFLDRNAARTGRESSIRIVSWMLVGECLLLLASAWQRLLSYEDAYGYTELRVHVHLYLLLMGVALLLLAREIATSIDALRWIRRTLAVGLGILLFAAYWNEAGWIVARNVDRFQHGHTIDAAYLVAGGPDAIPSLEPRLARLDPADRTAVICGLQRRYGITPRVVSTSDRWFEWNWRRQAAQESLLRILHEVPPCQMSQ